MRIDIVDIFIINVLLLFSLDLSIIYRLKKFHILVYERLEKPHIGIGYHDGGRKKLFQFLIYFEFLYEKDYILKFLCLLHLLSAIYLYIVFIICFFVTGK